MQGLRLGLTLGQAQGEAYFFTLILSLSKDEGVCLIQFDRITY